MIPIYEFMRMTRMDTNKNTKKGFTIVEIMVAMALFVILISIASGGFIRALRSQRTMVGLMAANDNASMTLEQMSREMRFGKNFIEVSENEFQFTNSKNKIVHYRLNEEVIERGIEDEFSQVDYKKITADNVKINDFKIVLDGQDPNDGKQPRITIGLSVSAKGKQFEGFSTNIQTTISSRVIDS